MKFSDEIKFSRPSPKSVNFENFVRNFDDFFPDTNSARLVPFYLRSHGGMKKNSTATPLRLSLLGLNDI
jgi:hypothetical protein